MVIFKRAEKYASEYRKKEVALIRLKRSAKVRGNYHVDAEPALAFVIRIRGCVTELGPSPFDPLVAILVFAVFIRV